jgi:hypothetical protein
MNARFVAGLAVAAIPIMSLLGAASASADNTVGKYNDPRPIVSADGHSVVRAADMAVDKRESLFAAPQHPRELAAIGQSWDNSFCHDADARVSERCDDRGR